MKIRPYFLAIFLAATATVASAVNIDLVQPGTLSTTITDNPASITELTVTGAINAADFDYINKELTALKSLNLSGAAVKAYEGDEVLLKRREFPADEIPAYALAGTGIATVVLPNGTTAIGDGAFSATPINTISLPATISSIGEGAFAGCVSLKAIDIPPTVKVLGENAFARCTSLEKATLSCPVPARAFLDCTALKNVTFGNPASVTSIGDLAFAGCISLSGFPFREGLVTVGSSSFEGSGLTTVDLSSSSSLTSVGSWAFAKCDKLTSVIFNDKLTTLGEGIFFEDAALVTVALPMGVTTLPDYSFKGATSIDSAAFTHSFITSIGNYATKGMTQMSVFTLPTNLTYLGDEAMAGWTGLTNLHAETLTAVPELGKDVWKGVDQSKATLYVNNKVENEFATTPQWQEFKITAVSGIDGIVADNSAENRVKAWFNGTELNLRADTGIANVALYGIAGMQYISATPYEALFTIDTAGLSERVYIVRIILDDDSAVTLKLAR